MTEINPNQFEEKIAELLGQMSLEEKIALTTGRNFWNTNSVERLGLEPITLTDGPHGVRRPATGEEIGIGNSLPATCFPTASALASSWDTALAFEIGQALGEESQSHDVQLLLGPGINIKRTPLGGRNFEYYSEDPILSGKLGVAFVKGVQSQGVGTSLKHYACNNQEWERMSISAEVDEVTLREIYLTAFEQVVKEAKPWTVMAAYNKVNGIYATENSNLLTDILKKEWGYEGVVVSDWGAVNNKALALAAGMDLEMPGPGVTSTEAMADLVRQGKLSEEVIDAAVRRLLALILRATACRKKDAVLNEEAHHELARRAAAESIVLLQNNDSLLPLELETLESVAVIGAFAKNPRYQGAGSSQVVPTRLDTPFESLQNALKEKKVSVKFAPGYSATDEVNASLFAEAVREAQAASVALIFAGLPDTYETEGVDRTHISLPQSHNRLIEEVCRVQPKTIVILQNGSAVMMPWRDGPKAIIEAGLGGQAIGRAIVDVLSGKTNPSGKLAETFPQKLEDTPAYLNYPGQAGKVRYGEGLFVGYRYYEKKQIQPLYPFGFGLSYTNFEYIKIQLDKAALVQGDKLTVTVEVCNTGERAGKEVVQLYVQPLNSPYLRPVKELKAFTKVALEAGETKEVQLKLTDRDFKVYDPERNTWRLVGGDYILRAGGSSVQADLIAQMTVKEDPRSARRIYTHNTELKYFFNDPQALAVLTKVFASVGAAAPGAGSGFEMNEMVASIPIGKLASYGLPMELVDQVLAQVNSNS